MTVILQLLTANAADDDLTPDDYRTIYDQIRHGRSLRDLVDFIGSTYSDAWWSRYEHGDIRITRHARNELRRAFSRPQLPFAVAELLSDPTVVSPDASVWSIDIIPTRHSRADGNPAPTRHSRADGNPAPVSRVILIGDHLPPTYIHVNNNISLIPPPQSPATQVAQPPRRSLRKSVHLSPDAWNRLNTARSEAGYTWNGFLSILIDLWNNT